jgi:hypothetical protein
MKKKTLLAWSFLVLTLNCLFSAINAVGGNQIDEEKNPKFVINAISHVSSSFTKASIADYEEALAKIPYYIEKDSNTKNPSRGKISNCKSYQTNDKAYKLSSILGSFFNKFLDEAFATSKQSSQEITPQRIKIAILLNRMRSVQEATNEEFFNVYDDLPKILEHKVIISLWEPQWVKREITKSGQTKCVPARFEEVMQYYKDLEAENNKLAHAFLQIQEYQFLNSIVPYRELRDKLLKDKATTSLVKSFRASQPKSPVYIAFMDTDLISLRTSNKGTFSCYEEAIIKSSEVLHGLTSGYSVSVRQNPNAAMAADFDLASRRGLASVFSLAPYYPEPNALIRVLDNQDTLEVSFPGISSIGHAKYTSPQEMPLLIESIIKQRFNNSYKQASPYFQFIMQGDIETTLPDRFLQNRKKKDGTKNAKIFSNKTNKFTEITHSDLTKVRNTSQSHLKSLDWSGYVFKFLKELMKKGSIRICDADQPGAIVATRKDHFLKSMFASIHSAYSPIAITLKEVKKHDYNLIEYLCAFVQKYDSMVPAALNITYGKTKNTRLTGTLLKKLVSSPHTLEDIINRFYRESVALLVTKASRTCGLGEIPIIIRYIQNTQTLTVPRPVALSNIEEKTKKFNGINTRPKPSLLATPKLEKAIAYTIQGF